MTHLALVGPTASGKSDAALEVARALGDVEIVSVDSMQVYRGLDIGTAKASPRERSAVPHHLIDVADPGDEYTVAQFQVAARAAITGIEARGRRALLVGGTGLYIQAVIDDLRFPGEDHGLRATLTSRAEAPDGVLTLYEELRARDPNAADRIDPNNARRIVRALEVIELTGLPFSSFGPGIDKFDQPVFPVQLVGMWMPRAALGRRVTERVEHMRSAGLVDEVRGLLERGGLSRTARQAIGYKEIIDCLTQSSAQQSTNLSALPDAEMLDGVFEVIAGRTRRLARRQRMWFRRDPRITWLATPEGPSENPCDLVPALLAMWVQ